MSKRYVKVALIGCCTLLFTSCSYQKKKVLPPLESPPPSQVEKSQDKGPDGEDLMAEEQGETFPPPTVQDTQLPDRQHVERRIQEYNSKLARWKELDNQKMAMEYDKAASDEMVSCLKKIQRVLNGYKRIKSAQLRTDGVDPTLLISSREARQLEQLDIAFLESRCGQLLSGGGGGIDRTPGDGGPAGVAQLEAQIEGDFDSGEFEEVTQSYQNIPAEQKEQMDFDSRLAYAKSLVALHREEEAAKVYQELVDHMAASSDSYYDSMSMRKTLADLYVATGRYDLAKAQYHEIENEYNTQGKKQNLATAQLSLLETAGAGSLELQKYSSLLSNHLAYDPPRDGYKLVWQAESFLTEYPLTTLSEHVDSIRTSAKKGADQWIGGLIAQVEKLAAGEQFQEALDKLESVPAGVVSAELAAELQAKKDDLGLAAAMGREAKKQQQKMVNEQQWTEAQQFMDTQKYDEAIEVLTPMLDSDYGQQAEKKITEASLLAARAERRKAADLFIQFTKATDIESKKRLLIDSRRHLVDIMIKYPDISIIDKVRGNIDRVEKEMNKIDPNLIAQAETVGEEAGQDPKMEQDGYESLQEQ